MRPIPTKVKQELEADPRMKKCIYTTALASCLAATEAECIEPCVGRITWEHAFIYAGKQINEPWAILGICEHHHLGAGLDKDFNRYVALKRLDGDQLDEIQKKYPRVDWWQLKCYLVEKYENN